MSTDIAKPSLSPSIEAVLIKGDLKELTPDQRLSYYNAVCESIGLNPLTRPFDYLLLNNKLQLYARKDCTDQLRRIRGVSVQKLDKEYVGEMFVATAYVQDRDGRQDSDIGAVNVHGLRGDAMANALMKAVTKAKRRATLSVCGLGMLDETEIETVHHVTPVQQSPMPAVPESPDEIAVREAHEWIASVLESDPPIADVNEKIVPQIKAMQNVPGRMAAWTRLKEAMAANNYVVNKAAGGFVHQAEAEPAGV